MTVEQWTNSAQVADGKGRFWAVLKEGETFRVEDRDGVEKRYTLEGLAKWLVSLNGYTFDPPGVISIDPAHLYFY